MEGFKFAVWRKGVCQAISIAFKCIIVCNKIIVGVASPKNNVIANVFP